MTTLVVDSNSPAGGPLAPKLGKVAVERRRRPLTVVFGAFIAAVILTTSSRWPVTGNARELFFVLGMCLACVGALGRTWSNLFISGYKSRGLVTTGPYSMCRNPLYFFSAVGMLGIGLATETIAVPVLLMLFFAAYYPMIIGREEQRLAARHLEGFPEYCRITPPFWPRLDLYSEPETYVMYPRAMRKNLADAFWFVAIAAIVHLEAHLQAAQMLPQLFQMW